MNGTLPALTGTMLLALTTCAAADITARLSTKIDAPLHAAVTDMPDNIDMSHADPKFWWLSPTTQKSGWASSASEINPNGARP
jgi:hypothetical protein